MNMKQKNPVRPVLFGNHEIELEHLQIVSIIDRTAGRNCTGEFKSGAEYIADVYGISLEEAQTALDVNWDLGEVEEWVSSFYF